MYYRMIYELDKRRPTAARQKERLITGAYCTPRYTRLYGVDDWNLGLDLTSFFNTLPCFKPYYRSILPFCMFSQPSPGGDKMIQ